MNESTRLSYSLARIVEGLEELEASLGMKRPLSQQFFKESIQGILEHARDARERHTELIAALPELKKPGA